MTWVGLMTWRKHLTPWLGECISLSVKKVYSSEGSKDHGTSVSHMQTFKSPYRGYL